MDKQTVFVFTAIIGLLILGVVALERCGEPTPTTSQDGGVIQRHGENVYYFGHTSDFGDALAVFTQEHPELRVISITSLNTSAYGSTRGYWVLVEKKEPQDHESDKR